MFSGNPLLRQSYAGEHSGGMQFWSDGSYIAHTFKFNIGRNSSNISKLNEYSNAQPHAARLYLHCYCDGVGER